VASAGFDGDAEAVPTLARPTAAVIPAATPACFMNVRRSLARIGVSAMAWLL
jgi:hypothetical protein